MNLKEIALKKILKRKLEAERIADANLNKVLSDNDAKILFAKCKELVVEIAKLDVAGKSSKDLRDEYNRGRELMGEYLKRLNIDKSLLRPQYSCSKCKDTGYVGITECGCLKREYSKELISLSGINIDELPKFNDDFSVFDDDESVKSIYAKMQKFIDEISSTGIDNILIVGDTGVGKTHLINCMISYSLDKNLSVKFSTMFNFNQDMLKYHIGKIEEKEYMLDPYINTDILFLDDLGSENKINNVTNEYLYLIINERMQKHKKTVITTNLNFAQIQDEYGERIFSRLMHKKQSLKVNFKGEDLRIKKIK